MPQSRKRRTGRRKHYGGGLTHREVAPGRPARNNRSRLVAGLLIAALVVAGGAYLLSRSNRAGAEVTTPSGLKYVDIVEGTGPSPRPGQTAVVHYTGMLADGSKFESSRDTGQPFEFPLGRGRVIKGWDEGIATMKVGGQRRLTIPPALGYGPMGSPPKIPGNATLIFDVELLSLK